MKPLDLTGHGFGRWLVLGFAGTDCHRRRMWRVRCQCGTTAARATRDLTSGKSLSCGCLRAEQVATRNKAEIDRQCQACGRRFRGTLAAGLCSDACRRKRDRQRQARPRPPCPCKWCGEMIAAPVKNQRHCSPDCAWQYILAEERRTGRARRGRLTPAQRRARAEYHADWIAEQKAAELARDAATLNRRLTNGA